MRGLPFAAHLVLAVGLALSPAPVPSWPDNVALAAELKLPVWQPGGQVQAPFYRADVIEVQLAPAAARAVLPRAAGPTRARAVGRLGLPALDAVAASVGAVAFEPEFRGERPPADGDGPDFTAFHLMHLAPGSDLGRALDAMRALPEVAGADPIAVLPVASLPNDSLRFETFWLERVSPPRRDIRAPEAWQVSQGDTGIVVAILDTGVLPYHPDLGGRANERGQMWANWIERAGLPGVDDDGNGFVDDVAGWDFVASGPNAAAGEDASNADNDPNDFAGHGTAVAGVVGAIPGNGIGLAGVAPNVRLMALRMGWLQSGATPPSGLVDMAYAAAAIRYATLNGAHVMNCSWQSENTGGLGAAVTAATRAGVILVNAAGNFSTSFTYLGQREDVISVAATDSNDVVWDNTVTGPWVDLSAAGVKIVSTMLQRLSLSDSLLMRTPSYRSFINGTSFSSPQVAGAVALLQAQRRASGLDPLTSMGANLRLRETTDDISALNPFKTGYGTGRLNLFRALTDPPHSLAVRTLSRSVGPGLVLRSNTGSSRVVYAMRDLSLIAFDGATGDTAWVRTLPVLPVGNIAAVDMGGPSGALIVVPLTNGSVHGFREDGSTAPGWPVSAGAGVNLSSSVAIADVDGDGAADVVAAGNALAGGRLFSWRTNGTLIDGVLFDASVSGISSLALADLDGVAGDEIAFMDETGLLHAVKPDGTELPGFPVGPHAGARAPVIARLGSAGTPPSVVVAATGSLTAYRGDGVASWSRALNGTPAQDPVLADLDQDGVDEIVLATSAPAAIDVRDSTGAAFTALPGWPVALATAPSGPLVVGSLTSPPAPSLLWFQADGLRALDQNGLSVPTFPKLGLAGLFPSLAELDGDGATEVAAGVATPDSLLYTYDAGAGTWAAALEHWPTPRGDFQRSASHAKGTPPPFVLDRIRPARVMDLVAGATSNTSALVSWRVTGDDSLTGTAQRVVLRRATYLLDESNFDTGILVPTNPPGPPGTPESAAVTDLPEGSQWWFALRVVDDAQNASALSVADTVALPGEPPGRVTDLTPLEVTQNSAQLQWTAIADAGPTGRPFAYVLSGSLQALDSTNVDAADFSITQPSTVDPGGIESIVVPDLTPGRRYHFAVRAIDESNTRGPLSNVVVAVTPVGGALRGRGVLDVAPRPNPAVGSVTVDWFGDTGYTGPNHLLIHDTNGRLLQRIELGSEAGGSYTWDGRDGDSRLLPAGLYFLRLVSGARHADSRVVFLRR